MIRTLALILSIGAALALGGWAYQQNHRTRAALDRAETLQDEIAAQRGDLVMLRAEWAYLNRPDRLKRLAAMNFEDLRLVPLSAAHFARPDRIPYPPRPALPGVGPAAPLIGQGAPEPGQ